MLILKSALLSRFSNIIFGFSTKIGLRRCHPYFFNMSLSVQDDEQKVMQNRKHFLMNLGLNLSSVAFQNQVHGDNVSYVNTGLSGSESDALITDKNNLGLAIITADCPAVFLFDVKSNVIAAIHSGWRGTQKKILSKVLLKLDKEFNCRPENLTAYIAPAISQKNYQVGDDVAALFADKYLIKKNSKYLLDLKTANEDLLLSCGVLKKNIQVSKLCSFEMKDLLHSYRRDGGLSGRAVGVISMIKA